MARKSYRVINGGTTYLLIEPSDAERILQGLFGVKDSKLKVYAIREDGQTERLQAASDIKILQEEGVKEFALRVGELSNMLVNIEP